MSLHSNTLSWFRANQSLLLFRNAGYFMEKQHINILVEPTIYRIQDDQANNCTITMAKINTLRQQWLFQFLIVNFLFTCINIPTAPIYGAYIPQLIRFSKACFSCHDFLDKKILLTRKTLLCWSFCCQFSNLRSKLEMSIVISAR